MNIAYLSFSLLATLISLSNIPSYDAERHLFRVVRNDYSVIECLVDGRIRGEVIKVVYPNLIYESKIVCTNLSDEYIDGYVFFNDLPLTEKNKVNVLVNQR